MPDLPAATLPRVLQRLGDVWSPWTAPHQFIFGMTGAGKTTLERQILGDCCAAERVLVLDPKPAEDSSWTAGGWPPAPVTALPPGFGSARDGGGPYGLWYRLIASHDQRETTRRFEAALRLVQAEGHVVLVIDDAHETCLHLGLRDQVDSVLTLGRSAAVSCIVATGETGYVPRSQSAFKWLGLLSGTEAAKAGARLLGKRGRDWEDTCLATRPYQWIYSDDRPGTPGPCRVIIGPPAVAL